MIPDQHSTTVRQRRGERESLAWILPSFFSNYYWIRESRKRERKRERRHYLFDVRAAVNSGWGENSEKCAKMRVRDRGRGSPSGNTTRLFLICPDRWLVCRIEEAAVVSSACTVSPKSRKGGTNFSQAHNYEVRTHYLLPPPPLLRPLPS